MAAQPRRSFLRNGCAAARTDFKLRLWQKYMAVVPCVDMVVLSRCFEARATCFEKRCRVRGRPDMSGT